MDRELLDLQIEYFKTMSDKIDNIYELVLNLERKINEKESVNTLKGIIHSIKGTSGSYEINFLSDLCHKFEDFIESFEKGNNDFSKLYGFTDLMREYCDLYIPGEVDEKKFYQKLNELSSADLPTKKESPLLKKILFVGKDLFIKDAIYLALKRFNTEIIWIKETASLTKNNEISIAFFDILSQEDIKSINQLIKEEKLPKQVCLLLPKGEKIDFKQGRCIEKSYRLIRDILETYQQATIQTPNSILIVDDDISLQALFKIAFKPYPRINLILCNSSLEALDILSRENFDIIIIDFMMPQLNGKELLEEVRKKGINTPIIFLTGISNPQEINKIQKMGVEIIAKPFKPSHLAGQIIDSWGRLLPA